MSVEKNEICLFLNTTAPPISIKRLGLFCFGRPSTGNYQETHFSELCEITYPHPNAPEDAVVSFLRFLPVDVPNAIKPTLEQSILALNGFTTITKLHDRIEDAL